MSDASMTDWMGYVYQQKPLPTNAAGVTVTLSVFDPNKNTYDIGTVTSDANGLFHLMWKPPVPGEYVVYAKFAGTNAYWPSSTATAVAVVEAPAVSPVVTPTPPAPTPTPVTTVTPPVTPPPTQTTSPIVTSTPTSAPPPTAPAPTELYIAIAAAVIIIVVIAAAVLLRRRK